MKNLSIDLETYSSTHIKNGVYKYCESPDFEILLFAYSIDHGPVHQIDLAQGDIIPQMIIDAILDPSVLKWAFNCAFERICLSYYLIHKHIIDHYLDPHSFRCSMVLSAYNGLPLSLKGVGHVLNLKNQKMEEGKDLIKYFCVPCKPTKTNGQRTRNLWFDDIDKWQTFKDYNIRDVEVEVAIQQRLSKYMPPGHIWEEYAISEIINDNGVLIDQALVRNAIQMDLTSHSDLVQQFQNLTNIENPNSVAQLKAWLEQRNITVESLGKKQIAQLMHSVPEYEQKVLSLRQKISKTSVKKYSAMINAVCEDGRCHGMFIYYGATRTGRFTGRIVQMQNLYRNSMPDLKEARDVIKIGDYQLAQLLYDNTPELLSQLIRTSFIPQPGYKYFVADYSAVEARVLSWLAQETWRMDVFASNGDIYCATASKMFKCKVVKHGENGHLRQKGKIAELALGYGGGVGAIKAMGGSDMGMSDDEMSEIVHMWRDSNPHIVQLWYDIDSCARKAIKSHIITETHNIKFECTSGMLFIHLPSGRRLSYVKPSIGINQFGSESITYFGTNGTTHKFERLETFGGKLTENIIQALARDLLCAAMIRLKDYKIVMHIHDELIIEAPPNTSLDYLCKTMAISPSWAKGLILNADGYVCDFYQKD